jgi:hypothetical protein
MKPAVVAIFCAACANPVPDLRVSPDTATPLPVGTTRHFTVTDNACRPDGEDGCQVTTPTDFAVTLRTGAAAELAAVDRTHATFDVRGVAAGRTILTVIGDGTQIDVAITVP